MRAHLGGVKYQDVEFGTPQVLQVQRILQTRWKSHISR